MGNLLCDSLSTEMEVKNSEKSYSLVLLNTQIDFEGKRWVDMKDSETHSSCNHRGSL